jgi:hypothetical protein
VVHVGRESNRIEAVDAGDHDPNEVWTVCDDGNRAPWEALVLPRVRALSMGNLVAATGLSERALRSIRNGIYRPRRATRVAAPRPAYLV